MNDLHWFCQNDFSEALFGRVVAETCFQSGTVNHQLLRRSDKASEICVRVIHEPHRGMRKDMLKALHQYAQATPFELRQSSISWKYLTV